MTTPSRLAPLLQQFDFGCQRLTGRMAGPVMDSGNGTSVEVSPMTDEEYRWEPVPGRWSVRRRSDGPGPGPTLLTGAGDWGRDATPDLIRSSTSWWVNQEVLHHGAEIALLRDLYRAGAR